MAFKIPAGCSWVVAAVSAAAKRFIYIKLLVIAMTWAPSGTLAVLPGSRCQASQVALGSRADSPTLIMILVCVAFQIAA